MAYPEHKNKVKAVEWAPRINFNRGGGEGIHKHPSLTVDLPYSSTIYHVASLSR